MSSELDLHTVEAAIFWADTLVGAIDVNNKGSHILYGSYINNMAATMVPMARGPYPRLVHREFCSSLLMSSYASFQGLE